MVGFRVVYFSSSHTYSMAEESISSLGTPEVIKRDGGNPRRNSMGYVSSSNSREKVLPHYLRASAGSCHDFCKYGKKHETEMKARCPLLKRIPKELSDKRNSLESLDFPHRQRSSVVKLNPSPMSRRPAHDTSEVIKREVLTKSLGESSGIIKPKVSTKLPNDQNPIKSVVLSEKKTSAVKLKSAPISKSPQSDSSKFGRKKVPSSSHKVVISHKEASSKAKEAQPYANRGTLKLKSVKEKQKSFTDVSGRLRGLNGRTNSDLKIGKSNRTPKVAAKKVLTPPRAALSVKPSLSRALSLNAKKHKSLKVLPSVKNQNKIKNAEPVDVSIELKQADTSWEKTLYVIKVETEDEVLESRHNERCAVESPRPPSSSSRSSHIEEDQEESEYTVTEAEDDSSSEYNETLSMEEAQILERENKLRVRKAEVASSEVKDQQPVKLYFRRGKVVDIQSENNSPRRLKFRRGKMLGENQNLKADARKSFKRRGLDANMNENKSDPEKVVLRHQDVLGKKDGQGLFNNVIEETASKLVETRKSKVKALVGAFETVISLTGSKASANIDT